MLNHDLNMYSAKHCVRACVRVTCNGQSYAPKFPARSGATTRRTVPSQPGHSIELEPPPCWSNRRNCAGRYLVEVDLRLGVGRRDGCGRVVTGRGRTESGESPEDDGADHGGSTGGSDVTVRDRCGIGRYALVGGVVCHVVSLATAASRLGPWRQRLKSANGIVSHRGRLWRPKVTRITVGPVEDTSRYKNDVTAGCYRAEERREISAELGIFLGQQQDTLARFGLESLKYENEIPRHMKASSGNVELSFERKDGGQIDGCQIALRLLPTEPKILV